MASSSTYRKQQRSGAEAHWCMLGMTVRSHSPRVARTAQPPRLWAQELPASAVHGCCRARALARTRAGPRAWERTGSASCHPAASQNQQAGPPATAPSRCCHASPPATQSLQMAAQWTLTTPTKMTTHALVLVRCHSRGLTVAVAPAAGPGAAAGRAGSAHIASRMTAVERRGRNRCWPSAGLELRKGIRRDRRSK